MKKLTVLTILFVLSLLVIKAQDNSDDINRLMNALQVDKTIDSMMDVMHNVMKGQFLMQEQGDVDKEKTDRVMDFMVVETTEITRKIMKEDMPQMYLRLFTNEEIKDLTKFYESPTGKKLLELQPQMSIEIGEIISNKYMPELGQKISELLSEEE